ncbi:MAG: 4Fe-4S ferredoxin, partial [Candidatus Hodarchaeota archaeon]
MKLEEKKIYRKLQEHLDKLPIGFPPTKSGVELKLLQYLFTPDEAKVATKLSFSYQPLNAIYEQIDDPYLSIEDLERLLENSVNKGAIHYKRKGGKK